METDRGLVASRIKCQQRYRNYVHCRMCEWMKLLIIGAQLAKLDVKSAYRIVPVHPEHRSILLGMQWQGQVQVDAALPLVCSRPQRFSTLWQTFWSGLYSTTV